MKNDDLRGAEEAPCGLNGWIIGQSTFTKAQRGKGFIFQGDSDVTVNVRMWVLMVLLELV